MKALKCEAADCVYNNEKSCGANMILISNTASDTYCDTYTKENTFAAASVIPANTEFGGELGSHVPRISCNVTQCVFNKSFNCRAHSVNIDDPHDSVLCSCLTYRPK